MDGEAGEIRQFTAPLDKLSGPGMLLLEVGGDSMSGDNGDLGPINAGDYVIIDPQRAARDGDIAAVWFEDWPDDWVLGRPADESGERVSGHILKRVRMGATGMVLESSNPKYPPLILRPENNAAIKGVVIGVVAAVRRSDTT
jgi:SOS-response transcriptional repressor LexA